MKREEEGMNVVDPEGVLLSEKESWAQGRFLDYQGS